VRYRADDVGVPVDPMSLEKHVFYSQSFYLALTRQPLFGEEVEAWRDGPVVPAVYHAYKSFGALPIIPTDGGAATLDENVECFLQEVVTFFGRYTALQLSDATHAEPPWRDARKGLHRRDPSRVRIPKEVLLSCYATLMSDGEEALSRQELLGVIPEPRWAWLYVAGICRRKMVRHPFYSLPFAEKLVESTSTPTKYPDDFYAPIKSKDMMDFGDTSKKTVEEIAETT